LRLLTKDPTIDDRIAADHRSAGLEEREVAMLDWALMVTASSNDCGEGDLERLRSLGWTDEDLMDMTETAAMFNLTNRLANALGWQPNPEYDSLGR
jgi:4-carboxymuconolactone decarboxylase